MFKIRKKSFMKKEGKQVYTKIATELKESTNKK